MVHFPTRNYGEAHAWVKQGAYAKRTDWDKQFLYYDDDMDRVWENNGEGLVGSVLADDRRGRWVACNARGGRPGTSEEPRIPVTEGGDWYSEMGSIDLALFCDTESYPQATPLTMPMNKAAAEEMIMQGLKYLGIKTFDASETTFELAARLESFRQQYKEMERLYADQYQKTAEERNKAEDALENEREAHRILKSEHKATKSALAQSRGNFEYLQNGFHEAIEQERRALHEVRSQHKTVVAELDHEKEKVKAFLKASEHLDAAIHALGHSEPYEHARRLFWNKLLGLSVNPDYDYCLGTEGDPGRSYIKVYGTWSHVVYYLVAHATAFFPKEKQDVTKDKDARI